MTTIKQALKEMIGIRVMCGHRWLIWNGEWVVYEKKPYQKGTTIVIETSNEADAVAELISD